MKQLSGKAFARLLEKRGWELKRIKGSHLPSVYGLIVIREADVVYISFRKPQRAKKTIETDDDILIRKDEAKIVGLTILNASTR